MAAKLTRLTHKIAIIQLHLVAESCTICSSRSRHSVRKLLDTRSYYCSLLKSDSELRSALVSTVTSYSDGHRFDIGQISCFHKSPTSTFTNITSKAPKATQSVQLTKSRQLNQETEINWGERHSHFY